MTQLEDFRQYLLDRRPELDAWGKFVMESIKSKVDPSQVSLQIVSVRVKDIDSAVGKIARKNYETPLTQMTDLVGVRFVVLISPQIDPIKVIIESYATWTATLDRDSNEEINETPESFQYQSQHYIVRCKEGLEVDGLSITPGLPCEIQVRTIMQHAYAEVTHDSIYKPSAGKIPPKARRFVASSMALIETADHLFCETMHLLEEENRPRNQLWKGLASLYTSQLGNIGMGYDEKLNLAVLDNLEQYNSDTALEEIRVLFLNRDILLNKIRMRVASDPFWSQPTALYAYWLVKKDSLHAFDAWPFASAHDALMQVYSDLGEALPQH